MELKRPPLLSLPVAALFAISLYAISAGCLYAVEPINIATQGFSISFPPKWHVETNKSDTILAGIKGEEPPFIIIYYATEPASQNSSSMAAYEKFASSSIADVIGPEVFKKAIAGSTWHSIETIHQQDGGTEERADIEIVEADGKIRKPVCTFARRYHKKHIQVYLAFIDEGTCKQRRAEFHELETSINWKAN